MRKTIRKVTIVVPVLMTNCHVSEKWNSGPVIPQTIITDRARMNAIDVPVAFVALSENRSRIWLSLLLFFRPIIASVRTDVVLGTEVSFSLVQKPSRVFS